MIKKNRQINILLIEDNPGDVRLTREALKEGNLNINLFVVPDGVKAMDYLRQQGEYHNSILPDLILLDLNLPKKDGREVLEEIKIDDNLKRIPVVVLTTSNTEQDVLRCYNLHANCYITKPLDFDEFFKVIQQIEQFWLTMAILPSISR